MSRNNSEDLSNVKEIPPKNLFLTAVSKVNMSVQPCHHDELVEYSMETCRFCQAIFHTKYDHYVHLAKHLVIKVPHMIISKSKHVKRHKCFPNSQAPSKVKKQKHETVKNIPETFNCKKLVVKVENFADLLKQKDELVFKKSISSTTVKANTEMPNKNRNTDNTSEIIKARTKLIDEIRNDILSSFVTRSPIVECRDDFAVIVKINNADKKLNSQVNGIENDMILNESDAAVIRKINPKDNNAIQHDFINSTSSSKKSLKNKRRDDNFSVKIDTINLVDSDSDTDMILSDLRRKSDLKVTTNHVEEKEFTKRKRKKSNRESIALDSIQKNSSEITTNKLKNLHIKAEGNYKFDTLFNSNNAESKETDLPKANTSSLCCRLIFEDDSDDEKLLLDRAPTSNVTDNKFKHAINKMEDEVQTMGKIMFGSKPAENKCIKLNVKYSTSKQASKSVHYEDLQRPGVYICRYCSKAFPNKYLLVCHEIQHIRIRQRKPQACHVCDRYIAGNHHTLTKHIERMHPGCEAPRKSLNNVCQKCGWKYYHYTRHSHNYHYIYACKICGKNFEYEYERDLHLEEHGVMNGESSAINFSSAESQKSGETSYNEEKITSNVVNEILECKDSVAPDYDQGYVRKICKVCVMFLKNSVRVKYMIMGDYSKVGEKQVCEKCQKSSFAVKLVKTCRRKVEVKWKKTEYSPKTAKLKVIQKRLKMMNKLTRL